MKRFVMNMKYVHLAKSFTKVPQAYGNLLFVQKVNLASGKRKNVCMGIAELVVYKN
jgi:hypothetical protein